jgi:formimidoylglutamate deiminase
VVILFAGQPEHAIMSKTGDAQSFQFWSALIENRWVDRPIISIADGIIVSISAPLEVSISKGWNSSSELSAAPTNIIPINGVALPGMANVHSHAFQRALAGLSEFRTANQDSFWTWRTQMYDLVRKFQPEDVYEIAKQLYCEMLIGGYTTVGEFHYLHTDEMGLPYPRLNELSQATAQAAIEVGINFCFIPALYQQGGFGRPIEDGQQRFYLSEENFFRLIEETQTQFGQSPNFHLAMALHSLRAVATEVGKGVVEQFRSSFPTRPIHIHVAEQMKEVEDCLTATGRRSIEYLFDQFDVDEKWCLIHCTQSLEHELKLIANSGAVVGLCPTTEANLGDGIFPAHEFLALGGRFGIGTDSQVSNNPAAELRMLEYSQRLRLRQRSVLATDQESVGQRLFASASRGGAQALGINAGSLEVGKRADLIVIDPQHPAIDGQIGDRLLDRWVICDYGNPVVRTMVGGRWID